MPKALKASGENNYFIKTNAQSNCADKFTFSEAVVGVHALLTCDPRLPWLVWRSDNAVCVLLVPQCFSADDEDSAAAAPQKPFSARHIQRRHSVGASC